MKPKLLSIAALVVALFTSAFLPRTEALAAPRPPKLVVLLAVDQMRSDYIELYGQHWKKGLRRLLERGAWFPNAAFPYLNTVTCAGHATLGTGAFPATHGMILNAWWDRASKKVVGCTEDPDEPLISYDGQAKSDRGESARQLAVPTLADEMKAQLEPTPRVVSFSMKSRSAIALAGQRADTVTWWEAGAWVTSKAFAEQPLPAIERFVARNPLDASLTKAWTKLLPPAAYKFEDEVTEERPPVGWSRTFPHSLKVSVPAADARSPGPHSYWARSPEADRFIARMAFATARSLRLGKGKGTDFLAISFSVLDQVGHSFGPRSHEVQDVLARLDATLGEFLTGLDRLVGKDNYVVALSADHGVAAFPEQIKAEGHDAGRVLVEEVKERADRALVKAFGSGEHVAMVQFTDIYLAPGVMDKLRNSPAATKAVLVALRSVPGVAQAFSTDELRAREKITDPLKRAAAFSHYPGRSGDLILVPKKNWIIVPSGTTHGTQNAYDQRVPVVLYGAAIKPGKYDRAVTPADIAPTLGALVGVKLPRAEGQPLTEALRVEVARSR